MELFNEALTKVLGMIEEAPTEVLEILDKTNKWINTRRIWGPKTCTRRSETNVPVKIVWESKTMKMKL